MRLEQFEPATLKALAAAIEARDPQVVARRRLSGDAVEDLADILLRGDRPSIGWWKRNLNADDS